MTATQQFSFGLDDTMPIEGSTKIKSDFVVDIHSDISHELGNVRRMQQVQNERSSTSVTTDLKLVETTFLDLASIQALQQQWKENDALVTLSIEEWEAELETHVSAEADAATE